MNLNKKIEVRVLWEKFLKLINTWLDERQAKKDLSKIGEWKITIHKRYEETWSRYDSYGKKIANSSFTRPVVEYLHVHRATGEEKIAKEYLN